jgi:hypothetical protein
MPAQAILWQRLDQPGHDAAWLVPQPDGYQLTGSAVFAQEGAPVRLDYLVVCDSRWQTRSARIRGWIGASSIALDLTADAARHWYQNAKECPAVTGCPDLDLSFSPVTNLLPIRRLELAVGEAADVRAAWLRFPSLTLEPLDQRYHRTGPTNYHYESAGGEFQRELEVNAAGFVIRYPGLWQAEAAT